MTYVCNCKSLRPNNSTYQGIFYMVEVDDDGVCSLCNHYAVAVPSNRDYLYSDIINTDLYNYIEHKICMPFERSK